MKVTLVAATLVVLSAVAGAQTPAKPTTPTPATPMPPAAAGGITPPADYVIGEGDVLMVIFWRDKDMSTDRAVVRPDGKITIPLINDVEAQGLTTEQLRDRLVQVSSKYLREPPSVTVDVKEINSRKVFISGGVQKPGAYPLLGPMTVAQLIAQAGSFREYVDNKKIVIIRMEGGKPQSYPFNYKEMLERKNLNQNILLKPGDTVLVPDPD